MACGQKQGRSASVASGCLSEFSRFSSLIVQTARIVSPLLTSACARCIAQSGAATRPPFSTAAILRDVLQPVAG